jgi:hypothetical protein
MISGPGPRNGGLGRRGGGERSWSGGLTPRGYGRARARAHREARVGIRSGMRSPGRIWSRGRILCLGPILSGGKLEPQDGHRHPFW